MSTTQYDTARKLVKDLVTALNAVIDAAEADDWNAVGLLMEYGGTVECKTIELNEAMVAAGIGEPFAPG